MSEDLQLDPTNAPVIICTDLYKSYIDGDLKVDVLKKINLQILAGESIAIVGASGSGKSTLLHLLGGLDVPTQGEISILGKNIATLQGVECDNLRNVSLGFIYQFHHLLLEFTMLENVAMPLLISNNYSIKEASKLAEEMLKQVGLGDRLQHKPSELSGGERQRVAIARAIVHSPKCVLADEPTGNLDGKTAEQVFNLMLKLKQNTNTSFVMVTHNLELAERMDKIYHLNDGVLE